MTKLKKALFTVTFTVTVLFSSHAQDSLLIKGVVLSDNNKPLQNVSVNIEGSANLPYVTNETGEFSVMSASDEAWLIVSPAGDYKTKRIFINSRKTLKIYLTPEDVSAGDDMLSILSREVRKRNIITSYSELNTRDMIHSPALTVDQYMQGRISGVYVINRSGMPGSGAITTIRGVNSINATNQPLYIIDGIPLVPHSVFGSSLNGYDYNPLVGINPHVISKATIIKDPTITAAYGSKGSNGIILIETLDPSVTQTTIELDLRSGLSLSPPAYIPQLNAGQHKTLMNEVVFSSGMFEEDIVEEYPSLFLTKDDDRFIEYQHNTNWQEIIFRNSYFYNINLKVKGGDEIARYGLSFRYTDNKGIIKTTGFQGYNLRFVSRLNIFTWLRMNAGVSLNYNSSRLKEAATVEETSPIFASLAKSPLLNPYQYDLEGQRTQIIAEVDDIGVSNPLAIIDNYEAKNNNYNFIASADFESSILSNLLINSKFSLIYNVLKEELFMPNRGMELYYDQEAINVAKGTNNDLKSFYNNTYLSYNKSIGNDHVFSSVTGLHIQTNRFELDWGLTKNAHENDQYRALQDGQNNLREIGGQNRIWNWMSVYENIGYSFRDKYLFSACISLDGSSRIGDNAASTVRIADIPFGLFYSGGVAWRLSNESFLKNVSWLEDLKLRFSAGKAGNDDIGEASATNYYQTVKFRETAGLFPAVLPNDELTYETVYQTNAGIDLSLLGNRFTTSFDIFSSKTDNMLIFSPVETYLGYDLRVENGGQLKNNGWEINTFFRILDINSFKWDLTANLSSFNNEVTEIKGDKLITEIEGAEIVNMPGSPANSFYGYIFKGVFSTQAEATEANLLNDKSLPFKAGDAMFEDLSGPDGLPDGIINDYDKTTIGSALPQYFGGIVNTFAYRRWTLSAFVQFVYGNDIFNYLRYKNERMTGLENQSRNVLNRWQYDGQDTDVPRASWKDPIGNSLFSTRWIEDGSYVRFKNITLSYRIPDQFLTFRNAEFYFSVNNIQVLTKYLGYDPEFAYSFSQIDQGIDYGQCPQPRQFIAGIRLGL
ncbi:MAG: SusC/RagA family TonB-linked outer membrane protein [Bacteroidales bacterium]|nr:SusC/RagA family TonB-linked outer membrane protein [Bacteroidales bacterium]